MSNELSQLARLLHVSEDEIRFLAPIAPDKIQFLYSSMVHAMQIEQAPVWSRIAKATSLLPDLLTAKVAEGFMGAQVAASVTHHMPARKAVNIAKHFSLPFLAEVTGYLDPEKIKEITTSIRSLRTLPQPTYPILTSFPKTIFTAGAEDYLDGAAHEGVEFP
jgi:hypothetical protein